MSEACAEPRADFWMGYNSLKMRNSTRNSLDAELGGCGMLMESVCQWINTGQPRPSVWRRLAARMCEALQNRVMEEEGQVVSLSNDTESTVASMFLFCL